MCLFSNSEAKGASTKWTGGRVAALEPLVKTVAMELVLASATGLGRKRLVLMQNRVTNGTLGDSRKV